MPLRLNPTFAAELQQATGASGASDAQATAASGAGTAAGRTLYGGWVSSGSPTMAEIMAGAGLDWLLIDMEHTPNSLEAVLHQLYAVSAYPTTPVVRVPVADATIIKQVLDLGAQNILVPMVSTRAEAEAVAAAAQYPPAGVRGVGSALARSARWNRVPDYLTEAAEHVSVFVQIETSTGVENAAAIASTPGIDGVFVGPSDLAASMGLLGQQTHPDVVAAVRSVLDEVRAAGMFAGVNAFDPGTARAYAEAGAQFILVGADVAIVARGAEKLAADFIGNAADFTGN
ncbi:HpcH/HpaI aldolase family protein [Brevibacterium luteolum]|uniref:2-dehydro-3-deoxyglucarate aldolase n=1 Tax=Brevibacterium luteolum TaxID=199591 RepID=A0A2N6PG02_9MICO|nr:HpcH/HpaI aldolase/citrate lyase family protein [Brevibacterium luteolum]MCT1891192.1 HpcH/HpaI aldolase/citrate lyase family protein [Brevibacterium luteolum]MCT1923040.1 HpcH/HpaI aldolase/citrate lyase family protein [Brevibacterium luteolum]PMB97617.1 2-dehydro-3-deoxyglucarate aldolase [Brevibacterium luteolum]